MKIRTVTSRILIFCCMALLIVPPMSYAQGTSSAQPFKAEELEQILAPVALYPDPLLTQLLMASTYPLEIVQADRWAKAEQEREGGCPGKGARGAAPGTPSVKSMVNFPDVLSMMSEKTRLDTKTGGRVPRAGKGCHGNRPEAQVEGPDIGQPEDDKGTGGQVRSERHRHRTGEPPGHLRAGLQPDRRVRRMGIPGVPSLSRLPSGLCGRDGRPFLHDRCRRGRGMGLCLGGTRTGMAATSISMSTRTRT